MRSKASFSVDEKTLEVHSQRVATFTDKLIILQQRRRKKHNMTVR